MEEDNSWISIHRKFKDWQWYKNVNVKTIFLHLLLKANFKDNYWKNVLVKRGQVITSIEHLADETGLTVQQTRTAINKLKSTGEITIKSTSKYSFVTIEKYDFYQQSNNKTTNKSINQITNNQQTKPEKLTTNNNDNNNNIYLYLLNKYTRENRNSFSEYIKKVRALKQDTEYKNLDKNEQNKLLAEI